MKFGGFLVEDLSSHGICLSMCRISCDSVQDSEVKRQSPPDGCAVFDRLKAMKRGNESKLPNLDKTFEMSCGVS